MSTAVQTVRRPATPSAVVALQWANPTRLVAPLIIVAVVVVVMVAVSIGILRAGGDPAATGSSGSVLWSTVGFLVAVGVQAVAVSFPFALALGATRRTFVAGTVLSMIGQAVVLTAFALVLLALEVASNGWFVRARVLRDATLGGGDPVALAAIMLLGVLTALAAGGVFGAAWTRFGAVGPLLLGLGLALAVAIGVLVLLPVIVTTAFRFEAWWLAVPAAATVLLSLVAQYLLLRRASVR